MTSVYRSEQARAEVRRWCVSRIEGLGMAHARSEVMTTAGVTGVVTAGPEPVAALAVAGQIERNYIREKTLEGQFIAASKGNHGGRPKVIDDDMLTFAVALEDKGVPVPEIAKKLTIRVGKNAGKSPSFASLYRALAEAEGTAPDDGLPLRPKPARVGRPEDPLTAEEIDLRERLQAQTPPERRRPL
ncbi:hypothetical protein [Streptomyces sp. CB00072]|uniref:hypothetical protein n=1 Tax=Streptomyces sp. CB00072 TaxID=1703928 RepID=UPI0009A10654|nr:hypothetical protein [Streptomyces sp. CB00072]